MRVSRESRKLARELFRQSFDDGRFDATRASGVVEFLTTRKPRGYFDALKEFARLVRIELARRHAVIQSAHALPAQDADAIQTSLLGRFGNDLTIEFRVAPELIGGLRVQVGDDVWDGSVRARLEALKN